MNRRVKVLLVPPIYGGSLPITYYCADALKELGHQVEIFDAPPFLNAYKTLHNLKINQARLNSLDQGLVQLISQAVYALAESFQPDLVLAMAQAPLNRTILKKFQQDNIKTAMWFVEDYKVFSYWQSFALYYDYFFIIQKEDFLNKLKEIGCKNAYYLPLAAMPNFHKKEDLNTEELNYYGSDLGFMGAGYPNRRIAFRSLIKYNFKIWGSDWDNDELLKKYLQNEGKRISPEESIKIYNATKINLNLHSSLNVKELISKGDFVNPRTFELASMQSFQLVDERSLMPELFNSSSIKDFNQNTELATFGSMEELHESITYYLKNPDKRELITTNARKRILQEHCYTHRMETLLNYIEQTSTSWLKEKEIVGLPNELNDNIKQDIEKLFEKYNLSPNADFNEILNTIKQREGELSEIETALLFLEEWKKFYS